jgi:hypothetical protein
VTHTAEARVETERSNRYLVQLCQHIGHMGEGGRQFRHRPAAPHTGGERVQMSIVESSNTHAVVDFADWGRCALEATSDALILRVDATSAENLRRLQDVLTRNLTRFGRRDQLQVSWPGPDPGVAPEPSRRRRVPLLGIILVKLGIVAAILVLPSGLAISLGAGHAVALLVLLGAAALTTLSVRVRVRGRGRPARGRGRGRRWRRSCRPGPGPA